MFANLCTYTYILSDMTAVEFGTILPDSTDTTSTHTNDTYQ